MSLSLIIELLKCFINDIHPQHGHNVHKRLKWTSNLICVMKLFILLKVKFNYFFSNVTGRVWEGLLNWSECDAEAQADIELIFQPVRWTRVRIKHRINTITKTTDTNRPVSEESRRLLELQLLFININQWSVRETFRLVPSVRFLL